VREKPNIHFLLGVDYVAVNRQRVETAGRSRSLLSVVHRQKG